MLKERPAPSADEVRILEESEVPTISLADCAADCDDPCSAADGFDEGGSVFDRLELDYDSNLLGSIKSNGRTVVVATGKADWPHSVTDEPELYAHSISKAYQSHLGSLPPLVSAPSSSASSSLSSSNSTSTSNAGSPEIGTPATGTRKRRCVDRIAGLGDGLNEDGTERLPNLTILCGSQRTLECEDDPEEDAESVMVFPDYKLVANLSKNDASKLVEEHLSPRILGPMSSTTSKALTNGHANDTSPRLQSFVLPYYAVILVCSHKRRDKRCHITADPLITALRDAIEGLGAEWSVDTRGDDVHAFSEYAIDSPSSTDVARTLKSLSDPHSGEDKQVGIFKTSHIGGHKFSGQLVIHLPNGTNIWYARVREPDCKVIVQETLLRGRIVRDLLRGGTALAGRKSVLEW